MYFNSLAHMYQEKMLIPLVKSQNHSLLPTPATNTSPLPTLYSTIPVFLDVLKKILPKKSSSALIAERLTSKCLAAAAFLAHD